MVKKLLLVFVPVLTACVTVNIYFPAAAVQRAADKIVEETWGDQGKGGAKEPAKGSSLLQEKRYVVISLVSEAQAQQPDINVSNPAIRGLKDSIKARSGSLIPFMDKGNAGIGRDGLLAVRTTEGLNLKERSEVQQLVDAENRDRENLYAEIARANNFPRERVGDIKAIFAKSWTEQAKAGWWIQDAQGNWKKN